MEPNTNTSLTPEPPTPDGTPISVNVGESVIQPSNAAPSSAGLQAEPASNPRPAFAAVTPASSPAPSEVPSTMPALPPTAPAADPFTPSSTPTSSFDTAPTVTVGGSSPATSTPVPPASAGAGAMVSGGSKRPKNLLFAGVAAVVLLGGGASAYYFGYKVNPSVIYSQSLKDTGKGYDKLIDYVDEQSKPGNINKGYVGEGSYKVTSSVFSTDGKLNYKGDAYNGELTFDVGLTGARITADIRALKSAGTTPDLYIKASGINGLSDLIGAPPETSAALNKLDNTWIFIDHTLADNLGSASSLLPQQADKSTMPTREDMLDEARAFGKVNQDYVFSTAKDKAVTTVVKKHGLETVDGHKTYHYTVALQKENVKKYITAQRDALKASKLGAWVKKNNYDKDTYAAFDDAIKSADKIKSSDTFDVWMEVDQRIVYKVRLPQTDKTKNAAENFVDIGLNYKGGDSYPFFLSGQDKTDSETVTFSFVTTLDTKSHKTDFKLNVNAPGKDGGSLTANFNFKPSDTPVHIDKPADAKPLAEVLKSLGLGDVLNSYSQPAGPGGVQGGIQAKASAVSTPSKT